MVELGLAALGVLIGWATTHYYHVRASEQQSQELGTLKQHTTILLGAFDQAHPSILARNQKGEIIGIAVRLSGRASIRMSARGELAVGGPDAPRRGS